MESHDPGILRRRERRVKIALIALPEGHMGGKDIGASAPGASMNRHHYCKTPHDFRGQDVGENSWTIAVKQKLSALGLYIQEDFIQIRGKSVLFISIITV